MIECSLASIICDWVQGGGFAGWVRLCDFVYGVRRARAAARADTDYTVTYAERGVRYGGAGGPVYLQSRIVYGLWLEVEPLGMTDVLHRGRFIIFFLINGAELTRLLYKEQAIQ